MKEARQVLEQAFKEEFGKEWEIDMRDFEHGFGSWYDAALRAIKEELGIK